MKFRSKSVSGKRERGAVAIITGLSLAVMIGFLGLSVDLGRLFVMKSELQTAMDACALGAATGLRPGLNDPNALARARAYGKATLDASMEAGALARGDSVNKVGFQKDALNPGLVRIGFGDRLDNISDAWADVNTARYARCSYDLEGLAVYFMRVLDGPTQAGVSAFATATMPPSSGPACLFPIALCNNGSTSSANQWGLQPGQWQRALSDNKAALAPGWFGWLDLDGKAGGGAKDLKDTIALDGYCEDVKSILVEKGAKQGVQDAWNTRFGLYKGSYAKESSPPDLTGYSYRDVGAQNGKIADNWAPSNWDSNPNQILNAYSGADKNSSNVANEKNYTNASKQNLPFQADYRKAFNAYTILSAGEYASHGRTRRVVPVPVFNCSASTPTYIQDAQACVLLLHPIADPKDITVEYLGRAEDLPECSTSGAGGGTGGGGGSVPVLVQ